MTALKFRRGFWNYPEPKEGPNVPYKNNRKQNPALSGFILIVAAFLLEWLGFVRKIIWTNAGFASLRLIRDEIEYFEPRFDPAVVPIETTDTDVPDGSSHPEVPAPAFRGKFHSVADYHELYKTGQLTPVAVVQALLPLIRRDTSPPGEHSVAWLESRVDLVLAAAEASTLRYKEKRSLGLFDGVPTGIKDEYDLVGYKTTLGSPREYAVEPKGDQPFTSWTVAKMEEAGAIILGKLSLHEYGLDTSGNNATFGTPRNPHNPHYYPGGSSSGCAYAVAAGLIPIALGSDGGGSLRIPASFCSVFGLKPTHARISFKPGMNHSTTNGVNGPIAADIRSLAAFFEIIAKQPPSSQFPPLPPLLRIPSSQRNKVIGIPEAWFSASTPAVQRLCRSLIDKLASSHGYTVVPVEIPFLPQGQTAHALTILNDAATLLPDTSGLTPANKILLALGGVAPATDFLLAQKLRQLLMQHLAFLWAKYPGMIIVTPTTSCAGWPIRNEVELKYGVSDGDQTLKTMEYVWMANFLGMPSLSVPAGFVEPEKAQQTEHGDGMIPVGLMGMGEWACEDELLEWGLDAEEAGADRQRRPPIWVDVVQEAKKHMKIMDI